MVKNRKQDSVPASAKQGVGAPAPEPNKIKASTPFDFEGRSLTAYGGLFPVATMLDKLGFLDLIAETLTVKRTTKALTMPQFIQAMVLASFIGFSRLYHLRFLEREPMLIGILGVLRLPPQSTFWRFLQSLNGNVAGQLVTVQTRMRERVWAAANVQLIEATIDTDTTVHTVYGKQMGGRKGYNPKNKGKRAINPSSPFRPKPRSIWRESCTMAIAPVAPRLRPCEEGRGLVAPNGENDICPRRFGFLLLGSGGSLRKAGLPVHSGGAQDRQIGERTENGAMGAVAGNRCRPTV